MRYTMRLVRTARTVGYVEFDPEDGTGLMDALEHLGKCPMDTYMHRFALAELADVEPSRARKIAAGAAVSSNPAAAAVFKEAALQHPKFAKLSDKLGDPGELAPHSPLVDLRLVTDESRDLHAKWMILFKKNIERHKPMPAPDQAGLPAPFEPQELSSATHIKDIFRRVGRAAQPEPRDAPDEVAKRAVAALQRIGLRAEQEKRHLASLAPVGLLREWLLETSVRNGCLDYELEGMQTAYGKGLNLETARASYLMEIVERRSAWAQVKDLECLGTAQGHVLIKANLEELAAQGRAALDPNEMACDAPYAGQTLHWIAGQEIGPDGPQPMLVPAQMVFLFLNLDEPELFSGFGSTGLATGNTMEEARLAALMEVVERDAEAVTPYHASRCFRLEAEDPEVAAALADYRRKGIDVAFQDLTTEFGIPCYKAFAVGPSGRVAKGAGAGLSGARAVISALTEAPYAYPQGPKSKPAPEGLEVRRLESLPDYSTGSAARDLEVAEKTLVENGCRPVYVNLTLQDVNIPVVRALVPGLEHAADFDETARVARRLFANYLNMYA